MNNSNYNAHLALLGANIIYGVNHIVAKGVMPNKIGPSAFVFLRIFGAGLLFWAIKSFIKEKIDKKDFPLLILCGLLGVAANQLFFFNGLSLTSPIDASIIITATPVLVLVFSAFMLKERITLIKLIGIELGAIGAALLILYGKKAGGTSSVLGNLFVFINTGTYALYLVLVKPLMKKYNPITIVSWAFLFGFLFMFPIGITDLLSTDFAAFTTHTYLTIVFVVLGTTFLAYLFNIYALSKVAPSVSGSYIYLQPVVSFIMVAVYAFILNQEQYAEDINYIKIFSCLMVVAGVYLISKKSKIPPI
ncbi:MAG TPA: EamA family transporter [Lutibacter sp.]